MENEQDNNHGKLFEQYRGYAYAIALKMLRNHHDAEDAVEESFVSICKRKVVNYVNFRSYLRIVVIRKCLDLRTKNNLEGSLISIDESSFNCKKAESTFLNGKKEAEDQLLHDQIIDYLLSRLSPIQKVMVVLLKKDRYQIHEIAEILNCNRKTVERYLEEAKIAIRELFKIM
jgi:RNA polymerase sigma-70 factor (ECF subfamily)